MGPIQVVVTDANNLVLEVTPTPSTTVILDRGIAGPPGPAGSGDVNGPASSTDNAIARFDGTTGKLIQNSTVLLDDNGTFDAVNGITFDTTPTSVPTTPGTLFWDSADGNQTLSLVMAGGTATQQIGEEQYFRIKASSAITNGQVVMFTGTVGASGALTGAPATGLTASTASYVMGIATQDMAHNDWGYVTSFGLVRNIDTSAFTAGQILYYDPTVAGGLTATPPSAPNAKVQVCACIYSSASVGSLFIRPSFGGAFGQYEGDVQVTSPVTGQLLQYDGTKWFNTSSPTIAGDITLTSGTANGVAYLNGSKVLTTGSALTFDGTNLGVGGRVTGTSVGGAYAFRAVGSGLDTLAVLPQSAGSGSLLLSVNAAESAYTPISFSGSEQRWLISGSEQMRLTSTGLGIGTSSPSAKLTVALDDPTGTIGPRVVGATDPNKQLRLSYNTTDNYANIQAIQAGTAYTSLVLQKDGGNVGIGTSSPAGRLSVKGSTSNSSANAFFVEDSSSAAIFRVRNDGDIYMGNGGKAILDTSGNLGLGVTPSAWDSYTGTQAFQIGERGSYLLGTGTGWSSNPYLYIGNNAYYNGGVWKYKSNGPSVQYAQNTGSHQWLTAASSTAGNAISFTQAMTLDASGNLLVGVTSSIADGSNTLSGVQIRPNYVWIANEDSTYFQRLNSNGNVQQFVRAGGVVGSISVTTTATAYNTSSDYRLKNITGPITNSGAYIDSLNPVEGTWKADGSAFVGLIAHEVQEASRTNVATGEKDGEEMQGMDYSSAEIIANLIAEIQSLRKRLAAAGI